MGGPEHAYAHRQPRLPIGVPAWVEGLTFFVPLVLSGGLHLEVGDEKCTHMVVEENSVKELPFAPAKKLYVVKQEVNLSLCLSLSLSLCLSLSLP